MNKGLVVVESPAKAKAVQEYLGSTFVVRASYGHVRDMPPKRLGVSLDGKYTPEYEVIERAKRVVGELQKLASESSLVVLATDPDREGEAIAWHLATLLYPFQKKILRASFQEITKDAVVKAIRNAGRLDRGRVDAQQARRVIDRLLGYRTSPLLWDVVGRGLSAGRVQTSALGILRRREAEIQAFQPQSYYSIWGSFASPDGEIFQAKLVRTEEGDVGRLDIASEQQALALSSSFPTEGWTVLKGEHKDRSRNPLPPFMTSTLQQASSSSLGFSPAKTMEVAQQLYEGVDLGPGLVGLITYMRTDSVQVSEEALEVLRRFIKDKIGESYLPDSPVIHRSKNPSSQEAHEAIRPTSVYRTPASVQKHLNEEQYKLYRLVWCRFVASQMKAAVYSTVSVELGSGGVVFSASGQTIADKGFLVAYPYATENEKHLPYLKENEVLRLEGFECRPHETKPPPRFTEAGLIKSMEEAGVGRPSTYASVIETLSVRRPYARLEKKTLIPTEQGIEVFDFMDAMFPELFGLEFTSSLESQLDKIANGEMTYSEAVGRFYDLLSNMLIKARRASRERLSLDGDKVLICPKCESVMVLRKGSRGQFWGCSDYPHCRHTENAEERAAG